MRTQSVPNSSGLVFSQSEILSKELLSIGEVAFLLRVSERQVRNLIYKGKLPACRISYHVTIITKTNVMNMIEANSYNQESASIFSVQRKPKPQTKTKRTAKADILSPSQTKGKENHKAKSPSSAAKPETPTKARKARQLKPATAYNQSVKDTFVDESSIQEPVYTMAEICKKFNYTYGRFYNLRMKYSIPCVKGNKTKCFPVAAVDKAMADEKTSQGKDLTEHYYTCFDIMRLYGLGKTQVRRFAQTHQVRIKKCGHINYYLKDDWEAARKKAQAISTSTKIKRE